MKYILFIIIIAFVGTGFSQKKGKGKEKDTTDTLPFVLYRNKLVLHTAISYKNAPFYLQDKFGTFKQLNYQPNMNLIHGVGIAYKWFSLNINYKLPSSLEKPSYYGKTKYFDARLQFSLKKWYFRIDMHNYKGFGIRNATVISDSIPLTPKNVFVNDGLTTASVGFNAFYFFDKTLNIKAATGVVGRYTRKAYGFYLRSCLNFYSVSSMAGIVPYRYIKEPTAVQTAHTIGVIETGAVPGYAYLNNINGWQFSIFGGLGGMIQGKYYIFKDPETGEDVNRGFMGLAPRIDLMIQGGYNVEKWFLMLTANFNQNNIDFNDFKYNQTYYNIGLRYGYRFTVKEKEKKKKGKK
ncbi:MAG: DUF4421 family protein [Brumimicrobium sp.]|nr:DUF4421 family protein [Brumimicrobium sp.]